MFDEVSKFIDENMLYTRVWDTADEKTRKKAVNNAVRMLMTYLPTEYPELAKIPNEHIAEQTIWSMRMDDSFQRAEMGATQISVDGFSVSFDKDRNITISPVILKIHNKTEADIGVDGSATTKRKVGSYSSNNNAKRWFC